MRHLLRLVMLLLFACPAWAETVPVRSGEHGAFTRIAIDLPGAVGWDLGRTADGYELRLDRRDIDFDLSDVFRAISRERVAGIAALDGGGRLAVTLGCDCAASAFATAAGAVAIDLSDGPADPGSAYERALPSFEGGHQPPTSGTQAALSPGLPDATSLGGERRPDLAEDLRAQISAPAAILPLGPPAAPPARLSTTLPAPRAGASEETMERAKELLIEQLAHAAAQGLVQVETDLPPRPGGTRAIDEAAPEPTLMPAAPELPLRAMTSVEAATPLEPPGADVTPNGAACPDPSDFAVQDWIGDAPVADQIAQARAALLGEFDVPDPDAVRRLARLYLALSMGPEAALVMRVLGGGGDAPLAAMAQILEDQPVMQPEDLTRYSDCGSAVALWAVLAAAEPDLIKTYDAGAILRGFRAYPDPVRRALVPGLTRFFVAHEDRESAGILRNSLSRAVPENAAAAALAGAGLTQDLQGAEPDAGLDALALSNDPLSAQATRAAIEARLAAGDPVPERLATHAEALAFASGPDSSLAAEAALAFASASDFDRAWDLLDRAEDGLDPRQQARTLSRFADLMTSRADDGSFLRLVFARPDRFSASFLDPRTNSRMAARLSGLGFHTQVARLLDGAASPDEDARLVLARRDLAEGRGDTALAYLSNVEGEAPLLRARARELEGDADGAVADYLQAGAAEDAMAAAWRNGLWLRAGKLATGARRHAIDLAQVAPGGDGDVTLASARALVEQARDTRETFEMLLAEPES
ncbi:hypothetical protein [Defluviimonas sp. WL0075]|uniref:Sel1 repeat family protein n=1 Tax=Albidovulum sediminicola TaxID=2984331 RepID=A0ABT2YW92_9RHOB|nr:hypothetical protein [Defluviimonas sp. WL0075]MCV2863132.1 hypothetical protein [Defluviimonas sp. WL0075]